MKTSAPVNLPPFLGKEFNCDRLHIARAPFYLNRGLPRRETIVTIVNRAGGTTLAGCFVP